MSFLLNIRSNPCFTEHLILNRLLPGWCQILSFDGDLSLERSWFVIFNCTNVQYGYAMFGNMNFQWDTLWFVITSSNLCLENSGFTFTLLTSWLLRMLSETWLTSKCPWLTLYTIYISYHCFITVQGRFPYNISDKFDCDLTLTSVTFVTTSRSTWLVTTLHHRYIIPSLIAIHGHMPHQYLKQVWLWPRSNICNLHN